MTRVDFYVLGSSNRESRQLLACRLTEKAYRLGHHVYVRTESSSQSRLIDDLLWTFRPGSFVPHAIGDRSTMRETPVEVGCDSSHCCDHDVLINLGFEVPPNFNRFKRVIELVDQDAGVRRAGRERYRYYQEHQHPLATHKLDGGKEHQQLA